MGSLLARLRRYSARDWAEVMANWSGPIAVLVFAWYLWMDKIPQNIASWMSFCLLDAFLAYSGWKAGRKPAMEMLYMFAAGLVAIFTFANGTFQFGLEEVLTLAGVFVAVVVWHRSGPVSATVIGAFTVCGAGVPNMLDSFRAHDSRSWWMWGICSAAAFLYLWLKRQTLQMKQPQQWAFPVAAAIFDLTMTIVVLL